MKTQFVLLTVLILMLGFSACREITVTTEIQKDGSFTRIITVSGDDEDVFDKNLPYPVDDSWTVELITKKDLEKLQLLHPKWSILMDTAMEENYLLTYRKKYDNAVVLNQEINNDTSWFSSLPREIAIQKQFGFFYTYLTFREVYHSINPFTSPKVEEYLTHDDLNVLANDQSFQGEEGDSRYDEAEQKAFDYLRIAMANTIIQTIQYGIDQLGDPQLSSIKPESYRDSIYDRLENMDFDLPNEFIDFFVEWTGNESFKKLNEQDPPLFDSLDTDWAQMIKLLEMEGFEQRVQMPGLITSTNSMQIIGNQVSWPVEGFPVLLADYEMHVESRIVNYWAFVVSGIIILSLILLLVLKAFRK